MKFSAALCQDVGVSHRLVSTVVGGRYAASMNCEWHIAVSSVLLLTFIRFDLEDGYDFVRIFRGDSASNGFLLERTGSATPSPVVVATGEALIQFRTDDSVQVASHPSYPIKDTPKALLTKALASCWSSHNSRKHFRHSNTPVMVL